MAENPNPNGPDADPAKNADPAGTEAPNNGPDGAKPEDDGKPGEGDESALGDAGKKALSEERSARKAAEKELAEVKQELARQRRSNAATKGTDLDAIRAEIKSEFDAQLVATEIKAEAKGRLTDVSDIARYPEYFEGIKSGDDKAITEAVDKLLKEKPYLAAESKTDGKRGWGSVGGAQRTAAKPEPASPIDRLRNAYTTS